MDHTTDVLVVGAGPVGLMLASELRRHGARCRTIDRLTEPMCWVKALGLSQRTLEVWDTIGLGPEALDERSMNIQDRSQHDPDALRADSQLYVHYRGSGWVGEYLATPDALKGGPHPGDRAPDVQGLRRAGLAFPLRLFDLLRGGHHTLLYGPDPAPRSLLDTLRTRCGSALKIYRIADPNATPPQPSEGCPLLIDSNRQLRSAYAVTGPAAYLIRPDGYVGFRTDSLTLESLARYLDRVFSSR